MAHRGFVAHPLTEMEWRNYTPPKATLTSGLYETLELDKTVEFLTQHVNIETRPWCGQCAGSMGFPPHRRGTYEGKCSCCTFSSCVLNCIFCASPRVGICAKQLRRLEVRNLLSLMDYSRFIDKRYGKTNQVQGQNWTPSRLQTENFYRNYMYGVYDVIKEI